MTSGLLRNREDLGSFPRGFSLHSSPSEWGSEGTLGGAQQGPLSWGAVGCVWPMPEDLKKESPGAEAEGQGPREESTD